MPATIMGDVDSRPDAQLIRAARERGAAGHAAFAELYRRHALPVAAFLRTLVGERAEDALQETFLRAHVALERLDAARPLRPWLLEVARNVAIDTLRARRKQMRLEKAYTNPESTSPVEEIARRERAERTRAALESLPDEARAILVERHGLGRSLAELAESWAMSERSVSERLREAGGLLAQALALGIRRRT